MIRGYCGIGLVAPKYPSNIGGVLRAAACYAATFVAIQDHQSIISATDTPKYWKHSPVFRGDLKLIIPYKCVPIAIEITDKARALPDFIHPERAFYIFGPENGSLDDSILNWCAHVIKIPTRICMNLAATVNVVLYDRMVKRMKGGEHGKNISKLSIG